MDEWDKVSIVEKLLYYDFFRQEGVKHPAAMRKLYNEFKKEEKTVIRPDVTSRPVYNPPYAGKILTQQHFPL